MWSGKHARGRRLIRAKRAAFGLGSQRAGRACIDYAALRRAVAQTVWQARAQGATREQIRDYISRALGGHA
jgi:hypothetical protein